MWRTGDNAAWPLPLMASQAQFTEESHTADGVQGSELAPRCHVHMHQMGVEGETKKLGEKNNGIKAARGRGMGQ